MPHAQEKRRGIAMFFNAKLTVAHLGNLGVCGYTLRYIEPPLYFVEFGLACRFND